MNAQQIVGLVIAVLLIAAFIVYIVWQIKKKGLRQFAVDCIVKAEDMYNHGDNEGKLNYVIDKVIAVIPAPLSLFITRETVKAFVQSVFDSVKKALDYVPNK
jgi:hypothetical protein